MTSTEDEKAAGWKTLLEHGKAADQKTLNDWKDELANLLTFTGLFSAVVTGFIVLAIPLLQEDSGDTSARLLAQISLQLSSFHTETPFINATSAMDPQISAPFQPDGQAIQINILWVASLTLTLIASFFTIAAQQWLRCIPLPPHLTIREAIRLRQFRWDGIMQWKLPVIISLLPVVVQASVGLFLAGLLLFLDSINHTVAISFVILGGSLLGLFVFTVLLPLVVANCPFKSPVVPTLLPIAQLCAIPVATLIIVVTFAVGLIASSIVAICWNAVGFLVHLEKRRKHLPSQYNRSPTTHALPVMFNILTARIQLWFLHNASVVYARRFFESGQFWLSNDTQAAEHEDVDFSALRFAPTVVPKGELDSILPCLDELPVKERLDISARWAAHLLSLTTVTSLRITNIYYAMTYTGPLGHAESTAFVQLRKPLWHTLPHFWDHESDFKVYHNRTLALMLCLLHRSIPKDVNKEPDLAFLQTFGERVFAVNISQDYKIAFNAPAQKQLWPSSDCNSACIPTTLLFYCCRHGYKLTLNAFIELMEWTNNYHIHLMAEGHIFETRIPFKPLYPSDYQRAEQVSVTAAATIMSALADDPSLESAEGVSEKVDVFFEGTMNLLERIQIPLVTYTRHIGVMSPGTHLLACNDAITTIAKSLLRLTQEQRLCSNPDSRARTVRIMSVLREVCDVNRPTTFQHAKTDLNAFDRFIESGDGTTEAPSPGNLG